VKDLAAHLATLGPVGRLPFRLSVLLADLLGAALALAAHGLVFPVYAAITALLALCAAALAWIHRSSPRALRARPVFYRLPGAFVALAAGSEMWHLAALAVGGYVVLGQLRLPPESWFEPWLPAEAVRVSTAMTGALGVLSAATLLAL
jgi:hypothetical protein